MLYLSEKLTILSVFLILFWILIATSRITNPISGLFSIVNRGYGRDTTRYNDINIYNSTRSKSSKNNKTTKPLNRLFIVYTVFTVIIFILTVITTKLGI